MTRDQLEHAIRAACDVSNDTELWIFGSQALLGEFPDAPGSLRAFIEVDIQPKNRPETVDAIDGAMRWIPIRPGCAESKMSAAPKSAVSQKTRRAVASMLACYKLAATITATHPAFSDRHPGKSQISGYDLTITVDTLKTVGFRPRAPAEGMAPTAAA